MRIARKVGLGLLMSIPGDTKPLPFVEDVAVPVENLGDFGQGVIRLHLLSVSRLLAYIPPKATLFSSRYQDFDGFHLMQDGGFSVY